MHDDSDHPADGGSTWPLGTSGGAKRLKHDAAYKLIFSDKTYMTGLLEGYADPAWVSLLDLKSLELVSTEHVTEELQVLINDLVWRARLKEHELSLEIRLFVELQSTVDKGMALRALSYSAVNLGAQWEETEGDRSEELDPVIGLVLHTGTARWTAKREVARLIKDVPVELRRLVPRMEYELIEQREVPEEGRVDPRNPAEAVLALGRSKTAEEIRSAGLDALRRLEGRPEQQRLFVFWWNGYYIKSRYPDAELKEISSMVGLSTALDDVVDLGKAAREEGLEEGEARVLNNLRAKISESARQRLGRKVADETRRVLAGISELDSLLSAYDWVRTCDTRRELLARLASI